MRRRIVLAALVLLPCAALGGIEKKALICEQPGGICFYWWPSLPPVAGWHHDADASYQYGINALAPDGKTFATAGTVIYAKALYKPRVPDLKSLDMLIDSDKREFSSANAGLKVSPAAPLATGDGHRLRSLIFIPGDRGGSYERVSYGEEGDFYLVFTLSATTRAGMDAAMAVYEGLVHAYTEKPRHPSP